MKTCIKSRSGGREAFELTLKVPYYFKLDTSNYVQPQMNMLIINGENKREDWRLETGEIFLSLN